MSSTIAGIKAVHAAHNSGRVDDLQLEGGQERGQAANSTCDIDVAG